MVIPMTKLILLVVCLSSAYSQELKSGPPLPNKPVPDWAQLPKGWNLGETSGVAVDKDDNVWVFNRGVHPVIEFDRNGKFLRAWNEVPVKSSHGIRVGPDGNIWAVDVAAHTLFEFTPEGRVLLVIGGVGGNPGKEDSRDAFNRPTGIAFAANGNYFISDGYINSRVVRFGPDGLYQKQWGRKGT